MKSAISLSLFFLLSFLLGNARTVVSESTDDPIIFASEGVINRDLGTVTDTLGNSVKEIACMEDTIRLEDDVILLSEVVVKPNIIKHKTAGRKGRGGFIAISVESDKAAGQGLAIPLKVKGRAWLKEIGFFVIKQNRKLSPMKLYRKEDGKYIQQSIRPVIFEYDRARLVDESFSYVFPDEVLLESGEYYVELEFLENFIGEYFTMASKPMRCLTRFRYASQSEWKTLPFGAPIYVDYDCIE